MSVAVSVLTPSAASEWTCQELAAFIRNAGFDLTLDDFDPVSQSGFLPGAYRGKPAGFEYFRDSAEEYLAMLEDDGADDFEPADLERMAQFDQVIELVTHSRFRDGAAACIAAGALAAMTGGVVLDNSSGKFISAEQALDWSREQEAAYLPHLGEDR
jgi:hypothetical protein